MFKSIIELVDILNYIEDSRRPLIEGTQILNCNHLIEFGIKEQTENKVVFVALCLQTSNLNGHPHEIIISKACQDNNKINISGSCSCKAGIGKCKHVVSFLLKPQKKLPTFVYLLCNIWLNRIKNTIILNKRNFSSKYFVL